MRVSAVRLTLFCLALLLLCSCQRAGPLPAVKTEGLPPPVRKVIAEAFTVAQSQPDDGLASGRLGMLLLAHGLSQPALASFERARILDASSPQWAYYAGVVYQERKNFVAAQQSFLAFLKLEPSSFAGRVRLAESLLSSGDKAGSLEHFAAAIGQRPTSARACYGMGLVLQADGKPRDARRFFEQALQSFPRYRLARLALAENLRTGGDAAGANAVLESHDVTRADLQVVPLDDPLMTEIGRLDAGPRGTRLLAKQLFRNGRLNKAVALLESSLRDDPRQTGYRSDLMMYFTHQQAWDQADLQFRAMIDENPDNAVAHSQRGEMLAAQGKCEEAVEAFDTALQIDPALAEAHLGLGQCQTSLGRAASAEDHFRKAVESHPDLPKARASLGIQLVANGKFSDAIPHLRKADSAHGMEKAQVLFALGTAYQKTGQPGEAQLVLETARILADVYRTTPRTEAPAVRSRPARTQRASVR